MGNISMDKRQEEALIERLQHYFEDELDQSIGQLAANQLFTFMIAELESHIYNRAVQDARKVVQQRFLQLDEEIDMLEKSTIPRNRNWKE